MKADTKLNEYYEKHFHSIEGFFNIIDAKLFQFINELQRDKGIKGHIFEIGVHHGKSAILLAHFIDPKTEILHVSDLFEEQGSNISKSGSGCYEIFIDNLRRSFGQINFLKVHKGLSQSLNAKRFNHSIRIFHIDGGHSAEETFEDLRFAYETTDNRGIIVIDDYFNRDWPGVSEGANMFFSKYFDLAPIMVGTNKVFMVNRAAADVYEAFCGGSQLESFLASEGLWYKYKMWMGREVVIIENAAMFRCDISTLTRLFNMFSGQQTYIEISVTNRAKVILQSSERTPIYVSYHLFDRDMKLIVYDNIRTPFDTPIHPGERVSMKLVIDKIRSPGKYYIEIDCVYEHVTWFKESASQSCIVELEVV
jgi:hypothetical protein